jgi:hypothetical protein
MQRLFNTAWLAWKLLAATKRLVRVPTEPLHPTLARALE